MNPGDDIRFFNRNEIDELRWDRCLRESSNEMIYAYTIYLDHMAKHWDGLILGDYQAIMPLTWNKKWGIKYLYQPPLTPQLGIFSAKPVHKSLIVDFLEKIPTDFRFAEIFLNHANSDTDLIKQDNFILDLRETYERISSGYKLDLVKNLKKSSRHDMAYGAYQDMNAALALHQRQYNERTIHVKRSDYIQFEKLCGHLYAKGSALLRSVHSKSGELLSVVLLLRSGDRLYLLESTTTHRGRDMQANHFLIDSIIKEFSGQELTLDFVGSSIAGIAHFYKNFGSVNQPYVFYYYNRLPWPFRYLK